MDIESVEPEHSIECGRYMAQSKAVVVYSTWYTYCIVVLGGGSNSIFVHGHPIFGKCTCTKCTKCTKTVFSCLEVPWKDLLAVANSQ